MGLQLSENILSNMCLQPNEGILPSKGILSNMGLQSIAGILPNTSLQWFLMLTNFVENYFYSMLNGETEITFLSIFLAQKI